MAIDAPAPAEQQQNPFLPPGPEPLLFEEFKGINNQTSRVGVKDDQMWVCDGFMPVGPKFLRTLYGVGSPIWQAPVNAQIRFFDFYNLGTTAYMVGIDSLGGIWQINTTTLAVTQIAAQGTIANVARNQIGISQFGSQFLLIVANQSNGYWIWDGTNFYFTGSLGPDITLQNTGVGYTSAPTVTATGGTGSGATFTAQVQSGFVTGISVTNPGVGYLATDVVALAFTGGGAGGTTGIVIPTITNGTISSLSVTNPGLGYTTSVVATVQGGGGIGGSVTLTITSGTISGTSIVNAGKNYFNKPTIIISDPSNPVARATIDVMPFGVQGTSVETFSGRAWVSNGAQVFFAAPGSIANFSSGAGGGNFTSADSFLRVGYTQLRQTNGFLYLVADSSINYISGVTTSGTPPTTTFTNQNAEPEVGTPFPGTIDVFGRNIIFANQFGAHVSYGAAVTKISDNLDGIFSTIPTNFGGFQPTAAKAILNGQKCWMLLAPIIDPVTGGLVNKLLIWNSKYWFTSAQDVNLQFVQHQEINSVITAYGTDEAFVYPLFQKPSTNFMKTAQSKLWTAPGGYQWLKGATRLWGLFQYFGTNSPNINISVDNEKGVQSNPVVITPNSVQWFNVNNQLVTWFNQNSQVVTWYTSAGISVMPPEAVGQVGVLTGLTISTSCDDVAILSVMLQDEMVQYRG